VWRFTTRSYRELIAVIPNALSASRILLGAAFPFVPVDWRLWLVLAAALSDALDGTAARLLGVESDTGRLLDPVADKFFILVLIGTLLLEGSLNPLWALGLASRDIVVSAGLVYTIARRQWSVGRKMRPSWLGKCTTAAQFGVILTLVAWGSIPVWVLAATASLSAVAALDYIRVFKRLHGGIPPASK
jgi:phosphatidylglycerophosphate synthase